MTEKGITDLLTAFETLEAPTRLIVAGDGPLAGYVDMASANWRKQGRFERYPRIPSADVPDLLRRIDVVVLPSRTVKRWREQFGRILVEAMASGCVVIGSDSGEIPNVIGDAGLIVPESNPLELGKALRTLEQDTALRARLSAAGRSRAMTAFSQASIAERTVEAYRRMMAD